MRWPSGFCSRRSGSRHGIRRFGGSFRDKLAPTNDVRCASACSRARCTTSTPFAWRVAGHPAFCGRCGPAWLAAPCALLARCWAAARHPLSRRSIASVLAASRDPGIDWVSAGTGRRPRIAAGDRLSRQAVGHLGFTAAPLDRPERETCIGCSRTSSIRRCAGPALPNPPASVDDAALTPSAIERRGELFRHRDHRDAEPEKGRGLVRSESFFSSDLCGLCALCGEKS